MALRYRIVDVFSTRPLAGNALCVVLDSCPDALLQPLAREVNLSETTFPRLTGAATYDVRIFTPAAELPFAGHPSIGTAWTLGPDTWTQTSPGATVTITADADGARMLQPVPTITAVDADAPMRAARLSSVAGCWWAEAGGLRHLIVATESPLTDVAPDLAAVAALTGTATFALVQRRDDRNLCVRVFAPGAGIPEDPGTGSAAGPIATVARDLWGTEASVTIDQGVEMGRPSRIEVDLTAEGPVVGGRVAAVAEGTFALS